MDLAKIKEEYNTLSEKLTDPGLISRWGEFQDLSKKRSALEKIVKKAEELNELREEIEANNQIILAQDDSELAALAEQELKTLRQKENQIQEELEQLLEEEKEDMPAALIMEIRAGTGGGEASLFAADLLRMYTKYAANQGWKQTMLDINQTDLAGIRETSFEIEGKDAFRKLQYEAGVHRVQRIPATEKAGRIHTSTASLAVLPKPKKIQTQINPAELKIEAFNASGPGGQNVNKRKTAVRITHLPTNLVVASQVSRNQHQNKENALELLQAKLLWQKQEAEGKKLSGERKAQIGSAMRAEKIRTYNFPQDRITDHRLEQSWHGIEKVMEGNLDEITEALQEFQRKER